MSLKRFEAQSHKEAMRRVRESLGADAIIVTSRKTERGFEVFALREADLDQFDDYQESASGSKDITRQLLNDVQEMRSLLQQQMSQNPPQDKRNWVYLKLRAAGYADNLSRELVALMPQHLTRADADKGQLEEWLSQQLAARLQRPHQEWDLLQHQGVIALVGPTGVGKTTTTAKLAAHYVMQMGNESLLLVTTDSYRVGAQQQLATYAELLDVDMFALSDDTDLDELARKVHDKRLVLIDTVGMSQRDHRLTQRIASLAAPELGHKPRLALLLNSASQEATLKEVADVYQKIARQLDFTLRDCILTKVDEASCLGGALNTVIDFGFCIQAVSGGQQVPEDLLVPNSFDLAAQSLAASATSAESETAPVQLSAGLSPESYALMSHAHIVRQCAESLGVIVPDFAQISALLGQPTSSLALPRQRQPQTVWSLWSSPAFFQGWPQRIPHFSLDESGLPMVGAVLQELLEPSADPEPTAGHLFDYLPTAEELEGLEQHERPWLAKLNRQHHVVAQNKKRGCAAVISQEGIDLDQWKVDYRGEQRLVKSRIAAVALKKNQPERLQLLGVKVGPGRAKGSSFERYFLVYSACSAEQARALIDKMLATDELPRLTRMAWQQILAEQGEGLDGSAERLYLSATWAALATRVANSSAPRASQARAQLMALTQRSGRIEAGKLMLAMEQVIQAHEAFRVVYQQEQ